MGDHLALCVDRLITSAVLENPIGPSASCHLHNSQLLLDPAVAQNEVNHTLSGVGKMSYTQDASAVAETKKDASSVNTELQNELANELAECRICQEEDGILNLETPCSCCGSLKYAHQKCIQRWCDEKGDTVCEICQQPFKGGYGDPLPITAEAVSITISDEWGIPHAHRMGIRDPHIFAIAADHHFMETQYEDNAAACASGATCCRATALVLMALLLLRHTVTLTVVTVEDDPSTYLTFSLLRAAGFLLPCYIMARAMTLLQHRHQRQEAAMAAAEVAILLQAGQTRGLTFTAAAAANGSA